MQNLKSNARAHYMLCRETVYSIESDIRLSWGRSCYHTACYIGSLLGFGAGFGCKLMSIKHMALTRLIRGRVHAELEVVRRKVRHKWCKRGLTTGLVAMVSVHHPPFKGQWCTDGLILRSVAGVSVHHFRRNSVRAFAKSAKRTYNKLSPTRPRELNAILF